VVVNRPDGSDVYKGVPKDRAVTGDDITPERFLAVLKGDKEMAGNNSLVLDSGPNDHVFVYLIDHGAPDLVNFVNDKILYAEDLIATLKQMHQDRKFAKLVFYLESCESGSMFDKLLPNDINVYVTTASAPDEESNFCCYDKFRHADTGSAYSNAWIENTETVDTLKETLQEQFEYVKNRSYKTKTGSGYRYEHTQQYGDLSIAKLPVSQFLGYKKPNKHLNVGELARFDNNCEGVNKRDVAIYLLEKQIVNSVNNIEKLGNSEVVIINPYVLGKLQTFVNICETMRESSDADIAVNQLIQHCSQYTNNQFINIL
ncbi:unnamed protein product, partial [Medioppia subpectinata]